MYAKLKFTVNVDTNIHIVMIGKEMRGNPIIFIHF